MPVPAIFYAHRCELPVKSNNQVGGFYHMTFQNAPRWIPGTRLKCHIAAIGEKNRQVCPHQSVAKIAGDQIRRDRRKNRQVCRRLKQRRRRRQRQRHNTVGLMSKNNRSARAFFILVHFFAVLCKTTTLNWPNSRVFWRTWAHDGEFFIFFLNLNATRTNLVPG